MAIRVARLGALILFLVLATITWTSFRLPSARALLDVQRPSDLPHFQSKNPPSDEHGADEESVKQFYSAAAAALPHSTSTAVTEPAATALPAVSSNAYVFYASADEYACSVLINIHRLQHLFHTKHRIFVLASRGVSSEYIAAFEAANATVSVQNPPPLHPNSVEYYRDCLLKLLGFRMHEIDPSLKRVLVLDSDQLVLRNLDHVFELPEVDLAAPRAYWIAKDFFSSTFMLINLSDRLWNVVKDALDHIKQDKYDMDVVNALFGGTVLMLPGSYVTPNSHWEDWNIPRWYRPEADSERGPKVNLTEIKTHLVGKRQLEEPEERVAVLDKVDEDGGNDQSSATATPSSDGWERVDANHPPAAATSASVSTSPIPQTPQEPAEPDATQESEPSPSPSHPPALHQALYSLYSSAHVLHYFALGKPWTYTLDMVREQRQDAHPLFLEQWKTWRTAAMDVCPPVMRTGEGGEEVTTKVVEIL